MIYSLQFDKTFYCKRSIFCDLIPFQLIPRLGKNSRNQVFIA